MDVSEWEDLDLPRLQASALRLNAASLLLQRQAYLAWERWFEGRLWDAVLTAAPTVRRLEVFNIVWMQDFNEPNYESCEDADYRGEDREGATLLSGTASMTPEGTLLLKLLSYTNVHGQTTLELDRYLATLRGG